MNAITDFASFLQAARAQPEPQRLLFVCLRVELPEDHDEGQAARYRAGRGGALLPVMYVDRRPEEVESFEALVEESRAQGERWQILLAAALAGRDGRPPSDAETDEQLKAMVRTVHAGGDLTPYLAFDSNGEALRFE
ncbi:hypothetical protein KBTX_02063 [wastewater metagenome]|uniref:Uncharacterized protein n=2 Tax=unclassified sequences TaxID=12908 RepID=A0A5B8R9A6_9ZZZZ|nr:MULTISPECIES: ribonucleotide reductase subunit alpha [Arhodomonas]MCS4505483.1 ribonucleotide reductase subunit alpha [Arhodomonas aquaeolei]QEA05739.1 hypothetical protein KBTEX_02063 [uncultured organism]